MKKTMMSAAMMALTAMAAQAQNPFVQTWFTSDPAPMVCGDRMYMPISSGCRSGAFILPRIW